MRVAFFGGTFDPPHRGHVALVRLARERLALDQILVAPVATQPLKLDTHPVAFEDRVAMTRLAFAHEPKTEISFIDAPRPNGKSNYTIDTLAILRQQLNPGDHLFCILGADSFLTIDKWHSSADLLISCDFIVGARPGFDLANIESALPSGISAASLPRELPYLQRFELAGENGRTAKLYLLTDLAIDISASEIRSALRGEIDTAKLLDPAVERYIRNHHLYEHL